MPVKGNNVYMKFFPTSVLPSIYGIEQLKQYFKEASFII